MQPFKTCLLIEKCVTHNHKNELTRDATVGILEPVNH